MKQLKKFLVDFQIKQNRFIELRSFVLVNHQQAKEICKIVDNTNKIQTHIQKVSFLSNYQNFQTEIKNMFENIKYLAQKFLQKLDKILKEMKFVFQVVKKQYLMLKQNQMYSDKNLILRCFQFMYESFKSRIEKEKKYNNMVINILQQKNIFSLVKLFLQIFQMIYQKKLEKICLQIVDIFPNLKDLKNDKFDSKILNLKNFQIQSNQKQISQKLESTLLSQDDQSQKSDSYSKQMAESKNNLSNQNLLSQESLSYYELNDHREMTPKTVYIPSPFKIQNEQNSVIKITPQKTRNFNTFQLDQKTTENQKRTPFKESNLLDIQMPSPSFEQIDQNLKENFEQNCVKTTQNRRSNKKKFNPLQTKITRNKSTMNCRQVRKFFFN